MPSLAALAQPDDPEGISLADLGAFEAAAARTRRSVKPEGGRTEGAATKVLENYLPHVAQGLFSLPERATKAAGTLFRQGDVYDPAPAVETALMTMGATPFSAPRGAVGAGPGIRAYHGSPHDFERFDLSKIGTGEGAQAYGHGLYFAENPKVAESYKHSGPVGNLHIDLINGRLSQLAREMDKNPRREPGVDPLKAEYDRLLEERTKLGRMYEVNINAHPEQFLDFDKAMTGQSPQVQSVVRDLARHPNEDPMTWNAGQAYNWIGGLKGSARDAPLAGDAAASQALREAGIPGIKYLDQGSRRAADLQKIIDQSISPDRVALAKQELSKLNQTSNYVLFRDDIIDILRKYGIAGAAAPALAEILASQHPEAKQ